MRVCVCVSAHVRACVYVRTYVRMCLCQARNSDDARPGSNGQHRSDFTGKSHAHTRTHTHTHTFKRDEHEGNPGTVVWCHKHRPACLEPRIPRIAEAALALGFTLGFLIMVSTYISLKKVGLFGHRWGFGRA